MQPALANIFQPLINVFEALLKFFHDEIGLGWGLAIVALTVLIRSLLLPLTLKQLRSMYRMAQFAPASGSKGAWSPRHVTRHRVRGSCLTPRLA
jgi:hypothetical protein